MTRSKTLGPIHVKDADKGTVSAVVATLGVKDRDGDVILPGAFGRQDVLISAYGHQSWKGQPPVGKGTIREVGNEAIFEGRFWLDTTSGRDTWTVVKEAGELQEWSFSLANVKAARGKFGDTTANFISSVKVKEVSPVLAGAGIDTRTLAVKDDGMADIYRIRDRVVADLEYRRFREIQQEQEIKAIARRVALSEIGYSTVTGRFSEVEATVVPSDVVKAAAATVTLCVGLLGIPRPQLRWYRPETSQEKAYRDRYGPADLGHQFESGANVVGRADRDANTVWLRADLTLKQAMSTAAHECRHLVQPLPADLDTYIAAEHDARAFEAEFAAAYLEDN